MALFSSLSEKYRETKNSFTKSINNVKGSFREARSAKEGLFTSLQTAAHTAISELGIFQAQHNRTQLHSPSNRNGDIHSIPPQAETVIAPLIHPAEEKYEQVLKSEAAEAEKTLTIETGSYVQQAQTVLVNDEGIALIIDPNQTPIDHQNKKEVVEDTTYTDTKTGAQLPGKVRTTTYTVKNWGTLSFTVNGKLDEFNSIDYDKRGTAVAKLTNGIEKTYKNVELSTKANCEDTIIHVSASLVPKKGELPIVVGAGDGVSTKNGKIAANIIQQSFPAIFANIKKREKEERLNQDQTSALILDKLQELNSVLDDNRAAATFAFAYFFEKEKADEAQTVEVYNGGDVVAYRVYPDAEEHYRLQRITVDHNNIFKTVLLFWPDNFMNDENEQANLAATKTRIIQNIFDNINTPHDFDIYFSESTTGDTGFMEQKETLNTFVKIILDNNLLHYSKLSPAEKAVMNDPKTTYQEKAKLLLSGLLRNLSTVEQTLGNPPNQFAPSKYRFTLGPNEGLFFASDGNAKSLFKGLLESIINEGVSKGLMMSEICQNITNAAQQRNQGYKKINNGYTDLLAQLPDDQAAFLMMMKTADQVFKSDTNAPLSTTSNGIPIITTIDPTQNLKLSGIFRVDENVPLLNPDDIKRIKQLLTGSSEEEINQRNSMIMEIINRIITFLEDSRYTPPAGQDPNIYFSSYFQNIQQKCSIFLKELDSLEQLSPTEKQGHISQQFPMYGLQALAVLDPLLRVLQDIANTTHIADDPDLDETENNEYVANRKINSVITTLKQCLPANYIPNKSRTGPTRQLSTVKEKTTTIEMNEKDIRKILAGLTQFPELKDLINIFLTDCENNAHSPSEFAPDHFEMAYVEFQMEELIEKIKEELDGTQAVSTHINEELEISYRASINKLIGKSTERDQMNGAKRAHQELMEVLKFLFNDILFPLLSKISDDNNTSAHEKVTSFLQNVRRYLFPETLGTAEISTTPESDPIPQTIPDLPRDLLENQPADSEKVGEVADEALKTRKSIGALLNNIPGMQTLKRYAIPAALAVTFGAFGIWGSSNIKKVDTLTDNTLATSGPKTAATKKPSNIDPRILSAPLTFSLKNPVISQKEEIKPTKPQAGPVIPKEELPQTERKTVKIPDRTPAPAEGLAKAKEVLAHNFSENPQMPLWASAAKEARKKGVSAQTANQQMIDWFRGLTINEVRSMIEARKGDKSSGYLAHELKRLGHIPRNMPFNGPDLENIFSDIMAGKTVSAEKQLWASLAASYSLEESDIQRILFSQSPTERVSTEKAATSEAGNSDRAYNQNDSLYGQAQFGVENPDNVHRDRLTVNVDDPKTTLATNSGSKTINFVNSETLTDTTKILADFVNQNEINFRTVSAIMKALQDNLVQIDSRYSRRSWIEELLIGIKNDIDLNNLKSPSARKAAYEIATIIKDWNLS